jgi:hypothetical protein
MSDRFLALKGYEPPTKPLSEMIRSVGRSIYEDENSFSREVYHPSLLAITEENITEKIFSDILAEILGEYNKELWFKSRVNLWELAEVEKNPVEVLRKYASPLQPDIDLLYCNRTNKNGLSSPLVGIEIKLFSNYTGYGRIIPKTTSWTGYYAGLDEAIALLNYGLDYVYLWHIFVIPLDTLSKQVEKYGINFTSRITVNSHDFSTACSKILQNSIVYNQIPIGYVDTYIGFAEGSKFSIIQHLMNIVGPELNPLAQSTETPWPARELILKGFGIEELKVKYQYKKCEVCNIVFDPRIVHGGPKPYSFCPHCGSPLSAF